MKIKSVRLERYKRFVDTTFDFIDEDTGKPYDLIVLVGENGCGKSSILQAIAATLGTATRQIHTPSELSWPGFVIDTIDANHRGKSKVTLDICFGKDEVEATEKYYQDTDYNLIPDEEDKNKKVIAPSKKLDVLLTLSHDDKKGYTSKSPTHPQYIQFRGRNYALHLIKKRRPYPNMFQRVGGVFWYHEYRSSFSLTPYKDDYISQEIRRSEEENDDKNDAIRALFTEWYSEDQRPKITKFGEIFESLFHERALSRRDNDYQGINKPIYFKIKDLPNTEYELNELSGGERAILPIILDFVRWDINNSIILIDELELHLHPPLQRALIYNLQNLGNNNQFIITTHSDYVANMVRAIPRSKLVRVDNV